ncbi:hypothetical protein [Pantoea stewartii]|uniref:hypothetical protein n=1 Tax=Pantoea stewartii TaxID=66269 RepID=UPI0025A203BF|nr:hypothetical protein [Pantoea stewartii]
MKIKNHDLKWKQLLALLLMTLCGLLRILNRSILMMPAMLIVTLAIAFYFAPEHLLSDVITAWSSATTDEKITVVKIFIKSAFCLSFATCFVDALITYPSYHNKAML